MGECLRQLLVQAILNFLPKHIFKAFWLFLLLESIWKEFHKRTELPETAFSIDLAIVDRRSSPITVDRIQGVQTSVPYNLRFEQLQANLCYFQ